jgi:hypothetical protein
METPAVVPNPGSDEAQKQGCECAVYDNNYGTGFQWGGESTPCFWINANCPLHGASNERLEKEAGEWVEIMGEK